jgi:hypothetical protein
MCLEIHEVQLIQSWHQRRNATGGNSCENLKAQKETKKERKKNADREQHFPKEAGTYQVTRSANARTKVMLPQCRLETSILT